MKNLIFLMMVVAIGFASCQKTPDLSQLSSDFVVSTNLDKNASFGSYKTYFISDTVTNLGGSGADTVLTDAGAQQLVTTVKNNMAARGYTFVPRLAHPDLGLKLGVIKVVNVEVFYPGWWGGYPGWGYPGYWGGGYPYYYPFSTVYTYTTGTLILDTYDLKNATTTHQYDVVWNCTAFGALGSNSSGNITRGVNGINQGFIQSPYLKAN
ncbi:DUF4136 domain-containing protein [Mucilaginibacter sp. McL0603]|uniref:DUF4136 domain-containing protein n=1 Tax=Mucilaginibacter sp. McL0603 TaxID=3415670 RepID=UPI003CEFF6E3